MSKAPVKKTKEYLISGDNYFPNTQAERSTILPPGAYQCKVTMEGAPFFEPISIVTDEIIKIPNSVTEDVVAEVKQFWSNGVSEKFEKYGLVHKRGILLAGAPGTGKTITLANCAEVVVKELEGIVLFNPDPALLPDFLRLIKDIEPNKRVLVMFEEFDSILSYSESSLLCLLDGETQIGNVVYLATTNYLSKIPSRIKNRPSRFARVIEVVPPDETTRRAYLSAKLQDDDRKHLEPMVQSTEGFVIDQLKDLVISVCCFNRPIDEAIRKIQEMSDNSMGNDDYMEQQAKEVFATNKKSNRFNSKGPLSPIK